ncbi:MAG TPA: amidohydrolase family protein [Pirellulaceae bacterium]|mgnify:CR=1 FL=1|nr:amidohydrolase family protein [Pirellulaceae bacterium]
MDASIIDCHCHAGIGDGLTGPWDTAAPLTNYVSQSRRCGIEHTVLFACFHSDYSQANRDVARIVVQNRRRFSGFVFVNPERDRGRVESLVREMVIAAQFCGIKTHRYDGRITREICEVAHRWSLPVLFDVMGEVSVVDLIAPAYPRVNFIIPHLGSFADDWKAQKHMIDPLCRYKNVFTDTSGIRRFDLLEEAIRRAGPGKVLFGSDGPWLNPEVELAKIHALRLSPPAFRQVTRDNWLRLTRIARQRAMRSIPAHGAVATVNGKAESV